MSIFTIQRLTAHTQALSKCLLHNLLAKCIEILFLKAQANAVKIQKDVVYRMSRTSVALKKMKNDRGFLQENC